MINGLITEHRLAMRERGFWSIPIIGKAARLPRWQQLRAEPAAIASWETEYPQYENSGMLTFNTPTIDVDILDPAGADIVERLVRERFGTRGRVLRRVGMAPKRAFPLRTTIPFKKLILRLSAPGEAMPELTKDCRHKIEVLCEGQQLAVDGIHPDTRRLYEWYGGAPWTVHRDELPLVDREDIIAFLNEVREALIALGWRTWLNLDEEDQRQAEVETSFSPLIVELARRLWGEPTHRSGAEVRFGGHGSKHVNLRSSTWYDFESDVGGGLRELMAMASAQREAGTSPTGAEAPRINVVNPARWEDLPVPLPEWVVPDRVPRHHVTLFSGQGAMGKSLIQLHLCVAHALGYSWLGTTPAQGPALFIDAEDGEDVMHKRLADILQFYGARFRDLDGKLHLVSLAGEDAVLGGLARGVNKIEPTRLYNQLLELMGDLKPVMTGIASAANTFAGSEMDRSQVQQFISLLRHMAMTANGALVLISHPSNVGISTNTGISGSTAWHNSVRARFYLKGVSGGTNGEDDDEAATDVRTIVFKKNNYGPVSTSLMLRWQGGLFLPVPEDDVPDAARRERAKAVFLATLRRFILQNRIAGVRPGVSYAPALFADEEEATSTRPRTRKEELAWAMRDLLREGKVRVEDYGRPGGRAGERPKRLVVDEQVASSTDPEDH